MRITSPPKHPSQLPRSSSPTKNQSTLTNISNQPQYHHLKSPQRTLPYKSLNSSLKQTLYAELRNKQLQYGQIITQINKENHSLKTQINNAHIQQAKSTRLQQFVTISPPKLDFNKTVPNLTSQHFYHSKIDHNRVMNQTFSGFNHHTLQPSQIITIRPNLNHFSKKTVLVSHSPVGLRSKVVTVVSPTKKVVRPVSSMIEVSKNVAIRSPQKNLLNHSCQPSLVSFNYASQQQSLHQSVKQSLQQSLDCSPKKSFQSIIGLDSQIFSNPSNCQHQTQTLEPQIQQSNQAPNSQFFDMKKRQVNYGTVFEKQKTNPSLSSKTIHTTLKMSTKKLLQNEAEALRQSEKVCEPELLNQPSVKSIKRSKKSIKSKEGIPEPVEEEKVIVESEPQHFDINENINKNPLLSMLKKRLQEETMALNGLTNNDSESAEVYSMFQETPKNPNIRYSSETESPVKQIELIHPLKRNINQPIALLHQLRTTQNYPQEQQQAIQMPSSDQVQNDIQNLETKLSLMEINPKSQGSLSEKISKEKNSQTIITESKHPQRPMTIVYMLQETKQLQNALLEYHRKVQQIKENDDEMNPSTDFVGVNRQEYKNDSDNQQQNQENLYYQEEQEVDVEQKQEALPQKEENIVISNKYYCQNTEENEESQSVDASSVKQLHQLEPEKIVTKNSIKNGSKSIIQQVENLFSKEVISQHLSSNEIIPPIEKIQTPSIDQDEHILIQTRSDRVSIAESTPCKFYEKQHKQESQKAQQTLRMNKSAQYHTFYVNKKCKNSQTQNLIEPRTVIGSHKYQESMVSASQSQNSLRSQRFKKISNRAYL